MNTKMSKYILVLIFIVSSSCSLAPGTNMSPDSTWLDDKDFVLIDSDPIRKIYIEQIDLDLLSSFNIYNKPYQIGIGDKLSITVWGIPDIFPMNNISSDQGLRVVNTDGTIFFPYVGSIIAAGKTQVQLRNDLTFELAKHFNDPQLDVSIGRFESQKVYVLGEVTKPSKLAITETPLSLADAIGQVNGLSTTTSSSDAVFVIRQKNKDHDPRIFRADLSSPSGFIIAGNFYLAPSDIVYVNAKGTTRWNRVISQFFPFSSFLNSVDNLLSDDS